MTGSLQVKKGVYYAVICYKDQNGAWSYKWKSTKIKVVGGSKKKAKMFLDNFLKEFEGRQPENCEPKPQAPERPVSVSDIKFVDFLVEWLENIKSSVQINTLRGYSVIVKKISEYFGRENLRLSELRPIHIQRYYNELGASGLSANSIHHYHANIRKCLQHAVKMELIKTNPADLVDLPKKEPYHAEYYNDSELTQLFKAFEGHRLELVVQVAAFYGFRRSELLGLKWDAVDFDNKTISVKRKVVEVGGNGKTSIEVKNQLKNASSHRTLPLIGSIEKLLRSQKESQEHNMKLCGKSYCTDYIGFIFTDELGYLIKPNYVSCAFPAVLKKTGLRLIRFHDLRHSCASLLVNNGTPMNEIQTWLGHSSISTTSGIYSHLEYAAKNKAAETISNTLIKE